MLSLQIVLYNKQQMEDGIWKITKRQDICRMTSGFFIYEKMEFSYLTDFDKIVLFLSRDVTYSIEGRK